MIINYVKILFTLCAMSLLFASCETDDLALDLPADTTGLQIKVYPNTGGSMPMAIYNLETFEKVYETSDDVSFYSFYIRGNDKTTGTFITLRGTVASSYPELYLTVGTGEDAVEYTIEGISGDPYYSNIYNAPNGPYRQVYIPDDDRAPVYHSYQSGIFYVSFSPIILFKL